jgi:hypothetical protein
VSTELENEEILARFASSVLGCSWVSILKGNVARSSVSRAIDSLQVHVIDCDLLSEDPLQVIIDAARDMQARYGMPPFIVIDYLQDLSRGLDEDVRKSVGDMAVNLRILSQGLDSAIAVVLSVSRAYYGAAKLDIMRSSDDPGVYLGAGKESGEIEYAFGNLFFLDVEKTTGLSRLAISKNRFGRTGFVGLKFDGASGRFTACDEAVHALSKEGIAKRTKDEREGEDIKKILTALHGQVLNLKRIAAFTDLQERRVKTLLSTLLSGKIIKTAEYSDARGSMRRDGYEINEKSAMEKVRELMKGDV